MALKFNPAFQTDEESAAGFVVRQYEYETIIDALGHAVAAGRPASHFLVVAPRGAGKTTLCRRVVAETHRDPALAAAWQAIFLGEESYAVTTPGEFFLECLFQLRDQAPPGHLLDDDYRRASEAGSETALLTLAVGALRNYALRQSKRLLVVVENFHTILQDQIQNAQKGEKKALIDALDDSSLFAVLATSVAQASDDAVAAVLAHYHRVELKPLTLGECHQLWEALTGTGVKEERLRPLEILTGGSPRLLHILADFMRTPSLHDLMTNLNILIDQNTEYFKSQLDALPAIERKVFAALLDIWDPSTAKQVADAARVGTNVASAMLARLTDRGAVIKAPGQGRTAIYYAAERLFNIYYLMRRRSHPSNRVRALVTFMMEYYDGDELVDTTALLIREACDIEPAQRGDYHSTFDAIMSHSPKAVRDKILARTPPDFIKSFRADQRALREPTHHPWQIAAAELSPELKALIERIEQAADADNLAEARALIFEGIEIDPDFSELWVRLSLLELEEGNFAESVTAGERARQLRGDDPWTHAVLGLALSRLGRTQEAEASYLAALAHDAGTPLALTGAASLRELRGDKDGAAALYAAAGRLGDLTRSSYGMLLDRMGHTAEAEAVLRAEVDNADNTRVRHALVEFLEKHNRQDEGIAVLRSVAEQTGGWQGWADLGLYLLARTSDSAGAKGALRNAIDIGGDRPLLYERLANAIIAAGEPEDQAAAVAVELIKRHPNDPAAWIAAAAIYESLDDEAEAEVAYRAALERPNGDIALVPLARLLQARRDRRAEARTLLENAIAASAGPKKCAASRELAELLIHEGNDSSAMSVVEGALQANSRCACCLVLGGDIYKRLGDNDSAQKNYRAALTINHADIAALTGLAKLVSDEEAGSLINRAIAMSPEDPRGLLARAQLRSKDPAAQRRDVELALDLDPDFIEAHLFLATLDAAQSHFEDAHRHIEAALSALPSQKELISIFVSASMTVAAQDKGERLSALLGRHENAIAVEPLLVALQMLRGERPLVAKEVSDVAWDIFVRATSKTLDMQAADLREEAPWALSRSVGRE
jgi:tetratricopeptide (TPR) repeat protein